MRMRTDDPLVIAAASPPDRHGYFSPRRHRRLHRRASSAAAGSSSRSPTHMPRTFGRNQIHVSPGRRLVPSDRPLVEVPPRRRRRDSTTRSPRSSPSGSPNGATHPDRHRRDPERDHGSARQPPDLGIHTELLSDGVVDLVESGVVNGVRKQLNRTKIVGTFALGTERLYDFLHENTAIELRAVRYVNDPRIIANEHNFVSINATLTVDFLGQCASETIGGQYYSSSGGQNDFARGAMYSEGGQGFVVLHSTTTHGDVTHRAAARCRRRGDDAQEHRRQGRHRVRRGRAPRPIDPRADQGADRHRPPRPSRRADRAGAQRSTTSDAPRRDAPLDDGFVDGSAGDVLERRRSATGFAFGRDHAYAIAAPTTASMTDPTTCQWSVRNTVACACRSSAQSVIGSPSSGRRPSRSTRAGSSPTAARRTPAIRSTYCKLPRSTLSRPVFADANAIVSALTSSAMPAP